MNLQSAWIKLGDWLLSLANTISLLFLSFYRIVLSPWMGGACRFEPSCSDYAEQCLKNHRIDRAISFIFKRLIKCRPLGPFGLDPAPRRQTARTIHERDCLQ